MKSVGDKAGSRMMTLLILVGAVALCLLAGVIGSFLTTTAPGSWYDLLVKPSFTPPSWLFFPVWTTLYVLMGLSLYLVILEKGKGHDVRAPLLLFGIQLVLNILWSFLFFGLESPGSGLVGIVALWISIAATMVAFFKINRVAAVLLIPYLVWVTIAAILNYSIYLLN
jgi:benzodiazapine receptor